MRSRTSSGAPACFISSLGLSGSRSPSAHWPSLRALFWALAGRAVVIGSPSRTLQAGTRSSPVLFRLRRSGSQLSYRWDGSTTSRQTATAANALEINVPPRHEGNTHAAVGDGHGSHCAMDRDERGDQVIFFLTVTQSTERPWTVGQTQPRIDWETVGRCPYPFTPCDQHRCANSTVRATARPSRHGLIWHGTSRGLG